MKINELLNKKREIIETNRVEYRNTIKKRLEILSRKIEEDKELKAEISNLLGFPNTYIFVITDQFLLCRYIDTFNGCIFSDHTIKYGINDNKEYKCRVKFNNTDENNNLKLLIFEDYIKDPYFCINYDENIDEYKPSTIYKDLINL